MLMMAALIIVWLLSDKQSKNSISKAEPGLLLPKLTTAFHMPVTRGLAIARGPVIAYLDSDNTWDRDYLSLVAAEFESNPNATSVYAGQYVYLYNEVLDRRYLIGIRIQPFNGELLDQGSYIDLNIFAHRRELYEQLGGFNEQMRRLVDWDLILKYTKQQKPLLIPALLAEYNIGNAKNQISLDVRSN